MKRRGFLGVLASVAASPILIKVFASPESPTAAKRYESTFHLPPASVTMMVFPYGPARNACLGAMDNLSRDYVDLYVLDERGNYTTGVVSLAWADAPTRQRRYANVLVEQNPQRFYWSSPPIP